MSYESGSSQSAAQVWELLSGIKAPLMTRIERYAALTIPKICLPEGFNAESTPQTHDYQSAGAQGVNHLTNKVALALFAPSRPFFRVAAGPEGMKMIAERGLTPEQVAPILAKIERDAVAALEETGQRPKLYQCIRHLLVAGNVLLILNENDMRVMGLRTFCVKRDIQGHVCTLIIKETVKFDELEKSVREHIGDRKYVAETMVDHYQLVTKNYDTGDYHMTQWVNGDELPAKFRGKWSAEECPYRVLVWDLDDASDYATSLVEEYSADLEAMSVLSEATVDGAVLGTEYRWLVNPTGFTAVEDVKKSERGDVLAGTPADIAPTQGGDPAAIQVANAVLDKYERRVALGFLMTSAVTRNAERVTAEEIRQTAQELETSFGGVYSSLAQIFQRPLALWLLDKVDKKVKNTDIKITVITGLDALSRNADLENLRAALADLAGTVNLPPQLLARIKFDALASFVGDGRGIDLRPFLMSDTEYQQAIQAAQQQRVQEAGQTAGATAQGEAQGQPQQGTP